MSTVSRREVLDAMWDDQLSLRGAADKILAAFELRRRPERTGTFPFLDLARDLGVPYGQVLMLSETVEHAHCRRLNALEMEVLRVARTERDRREAVLR